MTRGKAHVGVQGRSKAAQQGGRGLGAALFDGLDLILGHARPAGEIRDAQAKGDPPVVQGLPEGQLLADGDPLGIVGLNPGTRHAGVVASYHTCLSQVSAAGPWWYARRSSAPAPPGRSASDHAAWSSGTPSATRAPLREHDWVSSQAAGDLCTTAITVAEIRYGLERLAGGRRKDCLRAAADEVFTAFSEYVLPFDADAAVHCALIVSHRDGIGLPIEGFDAQIAAICRARGATLATRNVKDFRETGVDLVDPWQPS